MNNKFKLVVTTLVAVVALAACSSSDSNESSNSADTSADGSAQEGSQTTVQVDEEIKDALNVDAGSAVIPGSIEIVPQELGEGCTAAVEPLRKIMAEYPSVRQVEDIDAFNKALADARTQCEAISPQEWSDFYTKEVAGWIYAKTDEAVPTQPTETTQAP